MISLLFWHLLLPLLALTCFLTGSAFAFRPGFLVLSHNIGVGLASSMTTAITVEKEPPAETSYFWAQQFFLNTGINAGGYFGIQTGGVITGKTVGKLFIFSIWDATAAEADADAVAQTFGGEGVGYSIRKAVQWSEGVPYTFQLTNDGDLWWNLSVSEPGQRPVRIGRIQIGQKALLRNRFTSFTEYFRDRSSCAAIPYARTTFSNLTFGATTLPVSDSQAYGTCLAGARGTTQGNAAVHEAGGHPNNQ